MCVPNFTFELTPIFKNVSKIMHLKMWKLCLSLTRHMRILILYLQKYQLYTTVCRRNMKNRFDQSSQTSPEITMQNFNEQQTAREQS